MSPKPNFRMYTSGNVNSRYTETTDAGISHLSTLRSSPRVNKLRRESTTCHAYRRRRPISRLPIPPDPPLLIHIPLPNGLGIARPLRSIFTVLLLHRLNKLRQRPRYDAMYLAGILAQMRKDVLEAFADGEDEAVGDAGCHDRDHRATCVDETDVPDVFCARPIAVRRNWSIAVVQTRRIRARAIDDRDEGSD